MRRFDRRAVWSRGGVTGVVWLLVMTAACGSSEPASSGAADDSDVIEFCAQWEEAFAGGDDERFLELLEDPPSGIEGPAADVLRAERSEDSTSGDAPGREILAWVSVNCSPEAAHPEAEATDRRIALPADAAPEQLVFCSAGTTPAIGERAGGVVLYGESSRPDPYTGPMLGVVWGTEEDHGGDGDATPVRVRGTDGVAAPITVFQQVILEELGTVIAWREGDMSVGLYGRLWDPSRTDELVALADSLELADGELRLPPGAVPKGYEQVFEGTPDVLSLLFLADAQYEIRYQATGDEDGILTISGFLASAEEWEAVRFFTLGLDRTTSGERDAIVGNAWAPEGPAVVTWREADGLAVRLVGLGVDLQTVQDAADAARELTRPEWIDLIESEGGECAVGPG